MAEASDEPHANTSKSVAPKSFKTSDVNKSEHKQLNQRGINLPSPTSPSSNHKSAGGSPRTDPPNQLPRSPTSRYRHHSGSTSPTTRSPTPTGGSAVSGNVGIGLGNNVNLVISDSETARSFSVGEDITGDGSFSGHSEMGESKGSERKPKSVSFHSHTNWKSERKIQSGEYIICNLMFSTALCL